MADNKIANAIKFLKGEEKSLPAAKTEGQVYFAYKNVGTAEKPSYTGAIYIDTPIGGTQNRIKMTANADIADKAFNDSAGLSIRDTYLSSLGYTNDGKQTILIKGSGNNQTRIALPIASTTKSGIVTTDAQSFGGTKTFTTIKSTNLTVTGSSGFNYSGIKTATESKARPVWFADSSGNGKPVINTNFTYNPATQTLSVANLSGTADKANKDNAGNDIRSTYISNITVNGTTLTFTKGGGATSSITLQDTNNKVTQTAIKSSDYTNWHTVLWGASNSATEGFAPTTVTDGAFTSDTLAFQPSSGTLKAKVFKGSLLGNASTATTAAKLGRGGNTGIPMTFNWYGQNGQPSWLWGGNDGSNMYVYKPSNFRVANADTVDDCHESAFFRHDRLGITGTSGDDGLWGTTGSRSFHGALPEGLSNIYSCGQLISFATDNAARFQIYAAHTGSNDSTLVYRTGWGDDKKTWRTFIDSGNIGKQSVNYANSAGSVAWGNVSGKPSSMPASDVYSWAKASSKPTYSWGEITGKPSTFTPSNHSHGLIDSNFYVNLANTTTDNGWSMLSSAYSNAKYNGHLLKSIRTQANAPAWTLGNYAAGIVFGGADTKGMITCSYNQPCIKFAGGNGAKPVWYISLTGTSGKSYDLNNMPHAATATNSTQWNGRTLDIDTEAGSDAGWLLIDNGGIVRHRSASYFATAGHTHSYLPLSGGAMTGNITYNKIGTCYIGAGSSNAANMVGGGLNNLVISSWWGISFTTSCSSAFLNKNAVSIDCRDGVLAAASLRVGNGSGSTINFCTNGGTANPGARIVAYNDRIEFVFA